MKDIKYLLLFLIVITTTTMRIDAASKEDEYILGGNLVNESIIDEDLEVVDSREVFYDLERFFRPSNMSILNDDNLNILKEFYNTNPYKMDLPSNPFRSGKDTVINYFNVLREAANPIKDNKTGCGSLGDVKAPYPVAYNFLSKSYQKELSYDDFLDSFKNILHINLIKANNVPPDKDDPDLLKYFVELEVIEGSTEDKGLFTYYYGYIYLDKENDGYKIAKMNYSSENYLCAPYHGWAYDAQAFVEIEYGDWCSLIDGDVIVNEDGYNKRVYYKDKDGDEYYVLFYQLTNGVDKKIADYKKNKDNQWEVIYINPEKCIQNKESEGYGDSQQNSNN